MVITVQSPDQSNSIMGGDVWNLRLGMLLAWILFGTYVMYAAAVVASGATTGAPTDPYWAIAEIIIILCAPLQVSLLAVVHKTAPSRVKGLSLTAFGWMVAMAALTSSVHFVELTVARGINFTSEPALRSVFDFSDPSHPSLLLAFEFIAWHIFFGLSLLFASAAFRGPGIESAIRVGLLVAGSLSIAGIVGPAVGNPYLRTIGVVGYGLVFPIVCIMIGFAFRAAIRHSPSGS